MQYWKRICAISLGLLVACGGKGGGGVSDPPPTAAAAIVSSPTSLAFLSTEVSAAIAVTESGYNGTFTAKTGNATIATVTSSGPGNNFTVTAQSVGNTTITVADSNNNTLSVPVSVAIPNPLTLSTTTMTLTSIGETQQFTVSEQGYTGTFTVQSANSAIAQVSGSDGAYTVTAVKFGSTDITVADANGQRQALYVVVSPLGTAAAPLLVSPATHEFKSITPGDPLASTTVTVTPQDGSSGNITAQLLQTTNNPTDPTCSSTVPVVAVSPSSGSSSFTVTAQCTGTATVIFTDTAGNSANFDATVTTTSIVVQSIPRKKSR